MQQRRGPRKAGLITSLVVLAIALVGLWQWQAIFDWWRLRSYTPSDSIAALAQNTTMTSQAQRLFYVFHPEINSKEEFAQNCTNREQTIVLGCYVVNKGIYLYDVQDPRIEGVEQVTAAHEMLHVAYQRLSSGERDRVNALLQEAFDQTTDERIKANVESYRAAGDDVFNELHSILGTEVANLPPELEAYYSQYFTNRAQVVAYAASYVGEFTSRKAQVEQYDAQLAGLKAQINANEESLGQQAASLQLQRQQLDSYLAGNNYAAYNAGVPGYNNSIRDYNSLVQATRDLISRHNQVVEERNKVALEEQDLAHALDSRLQTEQAQ